MKKVLIAMLLTISLSSCQWSTRVVGGNTTIKLPAGQRLVEATCKNNSFWYLSEPMPADYQPQTKLFQESSNMGVLVYTVTFIETR